MMPTDVHFAPSPTGDYICGENLNLYNSADCTGLATQAAIGRQLRIVETQTKAAQVQLCEDDYLAWLPLSQAEHLEPAPQAYQAPALAREAIAPLIPQVIAFAQTAMKQPHEYLWGGTVAPNYDCSGLIQAAFASVGVWLPRDSYQQASFTRTVGVGALQPGDLLFFQETTRVSHVALYLGQDQYLHSSGQERGRNGIGIDPLSPRGSEVGQRYYPLFHSAGRVMKSYQPGDGW
ncbi:MAG: C40 family peptidase [Spirulina sp. SIO3F2]|nr:C40 family peptidase [Spirulina sp. SIO3F2]